MIWNRNIQRRYFAFFVMCAVFFVPITLQADSCHRALETKEQSRDDDFDGYPDFIEEALGYSAKVDDCMAQMQCGNIKGDITRLGERKNILIILDASGSMSSRTRDGRTRMEAAKEAISGYINTMPDNAYAGLMVYSAHGIKGKSCERIAMVHEIQPIDKAKLLQTIQEIKESGLTPMAKSLEIAKEILEKRKQDDNTLIFISDGQESCQGNPIEAIYALKKSPAKPVIHVIGFGVSGRAKQQLQCMAEVAGAEYHNVNSSAEMMKALQASFNQLNQFYKTMVCIHKEFNKYQSCETAKYNKANGWLIRNKLLEKDADKRKAIEVGEKSIQDRYFNYVKKMSSHVFDKKTQNLRRDIDSASKGGK